MSIAGQTSSFPSCTWERLLFPAKFHFALICSRRHKAVENALTSAATGSAIKLPQQVRSQVQLGNEWMPSAGSVPREISFRANL